MSSLPSSSFLGPNMASLERVESTPATATMSASQRQTAAAAAAAVAAYPYQSTDHYVAQPNTAFGYSMPYSPYYTGATLSPGLTSSSSASGSDAPGYPTGYGTYGFNMLTPSLPTIPPRYSMTGTGPGPGVGTPYSQPKSCISPLDLFSSPGGAPMNGGLPPSVSGSPHKLVPSGSYGSFSVSVNETPALGSSGFGLSGLGLGDVDTPIDMDSAPETNLASPTSSDDGDERDDEGMDDDDDDEPVVHVAHAQPTHAPHARAHTDTITLKIPRSPMTAKALALDPKLSGEVAPPVKKRSRTAQACERCRVRKARCFGGNPCNRCVKRKFECEFAPSRVKPQLEAKPKPKARRHSMHVPHNGAPGAVTTHAPLGRMHSHGAMGKTHARAATQGHATGMYHTVTPNGLGQVPFAPPAGFPNPYGYGGPYMAPHQHPHTHAVGNVALPHINTSAAPASSNLMGTLGLPMPYPQVQVTPYGQTAQPLAIPPSATTSSTADFSSSLGLNFGAAHTQFASSAPAGNALGLGLGLELSPTTDGSSPDSDLPSLMSNSYTSSDTGMGLSALSVTTPWSGMMDRAALPIVEDEMFNFSPVPESDAVLVAGWDEEPSPAAGLAMSSTMYATQEQLESVRDAATRQLVAAGSGEWYGQSAGY